MKQLSEEDKQLLLKDLCARLPYGVIVQFVYDDISVTREMGINSLHDVLFSNAEGMPYLRPMSSMTQEECRELRGIMITEPLWGMFDFFYSHHIDFRGLIPKGLALEANEDMYKIKEK